MISAGAFACDSMNTFTSSRKRADAPHSRNKPLVPRLRALLYLGALEQQLGIAFEQKQAGSHLGSGNDGAVDPCAIPVGPVGDQAKDAEQNQAEDQVLAECRTGSPSALIRREHEEMIA